MKNKLVRKADLIIIALVVLSSLSVMFFMNRESDESENLTAVITVDGEEYKRINLSSISERTEIIPETNPEVKIVAEKGCIYFESADCPDKICVKTGKLTKKGDTAVCLPSKTVISITGSTVDAITW